MGVFNIWNDFWAYLTFEMIAFFKLYYCFLSFCKYARFSVCYAEDFARVNPWCQGHTEEFLNVWTSFYFAIDFVPLVTEQGHQHKFTCDRAGSSTQIYFGG